MIFPYKNFTNKCRYFLLWKPKASCWTKMNEIFIGVSTKKTQGYSLFQQFDDCLKSILMSRVKFLFVFVIDFFCLQNVHLCCVKFVELFEHFSYFSCVWNIIKSHSKENNNCKKWQAGRRCMMEMTMVRRYYGWQDVEGYVWKNGLDEQ